MQISCGSVSWNHSSLIRSFYPDDLPDDWRLSYYANEFSTVLVPEQQWCDLDEDMLEQWLEDTGETFRFFFEKSHNCQSQQLALLRTVLGKRFGGVVERQHESANIEIAGCFPDETGADVVVALIHESLLKDLKLLRQEIDALARQNASVTSIYLFLDTPSALYKSLKSVQMLLELAGY